MTIKLASGAYLSGPAIRNSYPFSMLIWGGGPFPSSDLAVLEQSGTTGGTGSGGSVRGIMKSNGAKVAADAVTGWGAAESGYSGTGDWSTTTMRLLVVVFESASRRRVYFNSATPDATADFTVPNPSISAHTLLKVSAGTIADTQLAEAHFYDVALTNANVTSLLGGALPESISGCIASFPLKDFEAGGVYTSSIGGHTLTVTGTVTAGTLTHPVSRTTAGPSISSHPANQSVSTGAGFTFSVTASATGGGTLSYQWQKNGSNISGATSASYSGTAGTDGVNADVFRCVVTETGGTNAGSVNSNNATLTVTAGSTKNPLRYFFNRSPRNV